MSLNKKVLVAAVVGTLFAGNAAAVDFTAANPALTVGEYAKEIKTGSTLATATPLAAATGTEIKWESGYAYSPGEVRYVRVEASPHVLFQSFTPTATGGTKGALTPGAVNGVNTNVITFSVTADAANGASSDVVFSLPAAVKVTSIADANVSVSLYDTPSQAQAGGDTGKIAGGSVSGKYLTFINSLALKATAQQAVASVEATPSYTEFKPTGTPANLTQTLAVGLELATTGALKADGSAIAASELLDLTKSTVSVEGDFSLVASAGGKFDATAATRVQGFGRDAGAVSATAAVFPLTTALAGDFIVTKLSTPTWNPVIAASDYTAKLNPVAAAPLTYDVPVVAPVDAGSIVRDGTELQAPLAQIPTGWISRMVLTNTSGLDRAYTINVMSETGTTIGTDNTTGIVPATGTVVVDLTKVMTSVSGGQPRATLNVSVAGPNEAIQGLYQIVNPTAGSISNHVMVRPGQN